jgi:hypothetical protein
MNESHYKYIDAAAAKKQTAGVTGLRCSYLSQWSCRKNPKAVVMRDDASKYRRNT